MAEDEIENEEKEEKEEIEKVTRSIQVSCLNSCIEITSEDKDDTLEKMKEIIEYFLQKYK